MSDHTLTIEFDEGRATTTLNCHAPADGDCRVVWDCGCESWTDYRVVDGRPVHEDGDPYYQGDALTHVGRFDPEVCNLRDWHENSDEDVTGAVTVPIRESWEGECYLFDITPKSEDGAR